jgi:hypothetical protein
VTSLVGVAQGVKDMNSVSQRRTASDCHAAPARNEPIAADARRTTGATHAAGAPDEIALVVRQRRVHFDAERECIDAAAGRIAVGWTLRLFALHDKGTHRVGACPCCRRIALELRRVLEVALRGADLDASVEVGLLAPVLYDSSVVPGRDEVALPLRLWRRGAGAPGPGGDEACARHLRERLKRYGLSES